MRTLVAVVVLVGLLVVAWSLQHGEETAPPVAANPTSASRPSTTAPVLADAATEASTPVPVDAAPPSHRAAPTDLAGPTVDVQVVIADTTEPVPDAAVRFLPPSFDWRKLTPDQEKEFDTDPDGFRRRTWLEVRTDAQGRCRVPFAERNAGVEVERGEWFARAWLKADRVNVIGVRRDSTLRVIVVDANQQPAAGVQIRGRRGGERPTIFGLGNGRTDADGRIVQPHAQEYADASTTTLDLEAVGPGVSSAVVSVDLVAPPPEVRLQLPPTGSIVVHVRDAKGNPVQTRFLLRRVVQLAVWKEKPAGDRPDANAASEAAIDANGDALFAHVGFGMFVRASLGWRLASAVVPGPAPEAPRIEIVLTENKDDVVVCGVLVGLDGHPLTDTPFQVAATFTRGSVSDGARTDAAGRFRVGLGNGFELDDAKMTFKVGNDVDVIAADLPRRALVKGENDLGEVRLAAAAVLLAGRVVMADGGKPVQVQLELERQHDKGWRQDWTIWPTWNDDATFVFKGAEEKGARLRLVVHADGWLPIDPIEVAVGTTGIELVLRKGGSVTAVFLVDDSVPVEQIELRCRRVEPPTPVDPRTEMLEGAGMLNAANVRDGQLRKEWSGLLPGRYRVQAKCPGVPTSIADVGDLVVGDGPCNDPRLASIDLRGKLTRFSIRATNSDGTPIARDDAFVIVRNGEERWYGHNLGRGVVDLVAPAPVDLVVVAPGGKAAFLTGVLDSRTVVMESPLPQSVRLVLPQPLPDGVTARVTVVPSIDVPRNASLQLDTGRGMNVTSFFQQECDLGGSGEGRLAVAVPGEHKLRVMLCAGDARFSLRNAEPASATLPAAGELVLRGSAAEWERVRAALKK